MRRDRIQNESEKEYGDARIRGSLQRKNGGDIL